MAIIPVSSEAQGLSRWSYLRSSWNGRILVESCRIHGESLNDFTLSLYIIKVCI